MVVLYQKMNNLPAWDMLKHNMAMFNEEAGELSFSILARCVLGDTTKSKFDHLNEMYSLIHVFREIDNDLRDDPDQTGPKVNWRTRVKPESEEVTGTSAWLGQLLRQIQYNQVVEYNGEAKGYKNMQAGLANQQKRKVDGPIYVSSEQKTAYMPYVATLKERLHNNRHWGNQVKDVWPECAVPEQEKKKSSALKKRKSSASKKKAEHKADSESSDSEYTPDNARAYTPPPPVPTDRDSESGGSGDERWRTKYQAAQANNQDDEEYEDVDEDVHKDVHEDEDEAVHEDEDEGEDEVEEENGLDWKHDGTTTGTWTVGDAEGEPVDDGDPTVGALDRNARGEAVPWSKAGAVYEGNIIPEGRSRRVRARIYSFPLVNSHTMDEDLEE